MPDLDTHVHAFQDNRTARASLDRISQAKEHWRAYVQGRAELELMLNKQAIESIAETIAVSVRPILEGKSFPEAFCPQDSPLTPFNFTDSPTLTIDCLPLLSQATLQITDPTEGRAALNRDFERHVAQVLVCALLLGRRDFSAPLEPSLAQCCLQEFRPWIDSIFEKIENGCRYSSLGTRFEEQVRAAILRKLGLHPGLMNKEYFGRYELT